MELRTGNLSLFGKALKRTAGFSDAIINETLC